MRERNGTYFVKIALSFPNCTKQVNRGEQLHLGCDLRNLLHPFIHPSIPLLLSLPPQSPLYSYTAASKFPREERLREHNSQADCIAFSPGLHARARRSLFSGPQTPYPPFVISFNFQGMTERKGMPMPCALSHGRALQHHDTFLFRRGYFCLKSCVNELNFGLLVNRNSLDVYQPV